MTQEIYEDGYNKGIADAVSMIEDVLRAISGVHSTGGLLGAREMVEECKERIEGLRRD